MAENYPNRWGHVVFCTDAWRKLVSPSRSDIVHLTRPRCCQFIDDYFFRRYI